MRSFKYTPPCLDATDEVVNTILRNIALDLHTNPLEEIALRQFQDYLDIKCNELVRSNMLHDKSVAEYARLRKLDITFELFNMLVDELTIRKLDEIL